VGGATVFSCGALHWAASDRAAVAVESDLLFANTARQSERVAM